MNNCKNCNKQLTGKFCSGCGYPNKLKRIDRQYIVDEVSSIINFDRGIFYTIKELFKRPRDTVREFIHEDRKKIIKPITFLIICSFFYTIIQQFLGFEANYININVASRNTPFVVKVYDWFSKNYGYANIIMTILIALWVKIFFKRYNYNYYEIYILVCFTMGISILILTFLGIIGSIINYPVLQFGIFTSLLYNTWAIGQFFDKKKKLNYLKAFLSYIFGIVSFLFIFILIGIVLDKLIK